MLMASRSVWERTAVEAQHVKCRGMIKRFFTSNVDATKLQGLVQEVNESIQGFVVSIVASARSFHWSLTAT